MRADEGAKEGRVLCGGGWLFNMHLCRCAMRYHRYYSEVIGGLGFRLARSAPKQWLAGWR